MTASSRSRLRSDRGATAVFISLALLLIMGFVALGIDISLHTNNRQDLWDTLDAAALAGSALLPDAAAASQTAIAYADANSPGVVPNIDFWCVVGVDGSGNPNAAHIPGMCDPGPGPYTSGSYPGLECNDRQCLIPCNPFAPQFDRCNTMSVRAVRDVPYTFARVIGIDQGSTGVLTSAACKGPCGTEIDVPGDIVMVLDRTGSMRPEDLTALDAAARVFLQGLNPGVHEVGLGTIGRSDPIPICPSQPSPNENVGPWIPVGLDDDFQSPTSDIVRAIDCLSSSSTGTNLGDPMAAAGAHLASSGRAEAPNGVVFMTDGEANRGTGNPCLHAKNQATQVKAAGTVVVTIAYRLQGVNCGIEPATTVLADMASDPQNGPVTADDGGDGAGGLPGGCESAAAIASENADGDHFLCTPEPGQLAAIFAEAASTILAEFSDRTILVRPPS